MARGNQNLRIRRVKNPCGRAIVALPLGIRVTGVVEGIICKGLSVDIDIAVLNAYALTTDGDQAFHSTPCGERWGFGYAKHDNVTGM
jgi:hypothetical protein